MPYIGNNHIAGDHTNNFKVLDDISSFTATFDGSATSVIDTTNNTIRVVEHRFIQGQRVTYTNGSGGNIGGLTTGTAYFVIFDSASTIKLATSASNAASSTAINLSAVGTGSSHTLNVAFDGVNTKFKITYNGGTGARFNNATQLNIAINNVLQKPNVNSTTFTEGFAIEDNHKIVFQTAPTSQDIFWGSIIANTLTTFDISDHKIDTFTGDGSTTEFTLSHTPANNESLMVTINGVLQHPSNASTARAYTLIASIIQFTAAPGVGDEIQVRHLGFAGATTADVSGFYGRTGNVVLGSTDHITTGDITSRNINSSGIITASSFVGSFSPNVGGSNANFTGIVTAGTFKGGNIDAVDGAFSGNVTIGGTLTYEDVTNIDSVGLVTARDGIFIPNNEKLELSGSVGSSKIRLYQHPSLGSMLEFTSQSTGYIGHNASGASKSLVLNSGNDFVFQGLQSNGAVVNIARFYKSGQRCALNADGVEKFTTSSKGIQVGTGVTIETNGQATYTGIVTASAFKLSDGSNVGGVESDAQYNTVGGTNSGDSFSGTSAVRNTLFGYDSGTAITTGDNHVAVGAHALDAITTASDAVAIGYNAGSSLSVGQCVLIGSKCAPSATTASGIVGVGYEVYQYLIDGQFNTAVGSQSMNRITSGDKNSSYGALSLIYAQTSDENTALGFRALGREPVTGNSNTAVGCEAGATGTNDITSGANNILLGYKAQATSATVSNEVTIGDSNITRFRVPGIGLDLTSAPPTLTNGVDNRVVTATGAAGLNGEANLTFDGTSMVIGGGSAANVLDLGTATGNKGISWGGASFNYTNIWAEYGSGSLWLGAGLKSKTTNTGFYSSYGGSSFARSAIELESFSGGGIKFFTSAAQTVATDGAITVDERLRITSNGGVVVSKGGNNAFSTGVISALDVRAPEGTKQLVVSNSTYESGTFDNEAGIWFKGNYSGDNERAKSAIIHKNIGDYGVGGLHFCVDNGYDNQNVSYADRKMSITKDGDISIGVESHDPLTRLHVQDSNNGALKDVLTITNSYGSANTEVGMVFECGADELARISAKHEGSDIGPLIFSTASSTNANPSEKLRITSDGRLFVNSSAVVNTDDFLTVKRPSSGFSVCSMTVDASNATGSYANALIFTKSKDYYYNGLVFTSSTGHQGGIAAKMTTNGGSTPEIQIRIGGTSFNQSDTLAMAVKNTGTVQAHRHLTSRNGIVQINQVTSQTRYAGSIASVDLITGSTFTPKTSAPRFLIMIFCPVNASDDSDAYGSNTNPYHYGRIEYRKNGGSWLECNDQGSTSNQGGHAAHIELSPNRTGDSTTDYWSGNRYRMEHKCATILVTNVGDCGDSGNVQFKLRGYTSNQGTFVQIGQPHGFGTDDNYPVQPWGFTVFELAPDNNAYTAY